MDIQKAMTVINSIKEIPYLKEESVKNGDLSNVNSMSIMHYVLFPLLTNLGYEVFNPNEVKVVGLNNVELYGQGYKALEIEILDGNDNLDNKNVSQSLKIYTNGILYRVVGKDETIIKFDIREIEKENVQLLFSLLMKESLLHNVTNSKFIDEKVIESKYGNLLESNYVLNSLEHLLSNPSDLLIESIVESFANMYLEKISKEKIKEVLLSEIKEKGLSKVLNLVTNNESKSVNINVTDTSNNNFNQSTSTEEKSTEIEPAELTTEVTDDPYLTLDTEPVNNVVSEDVVKVEEVDTVNKEEKILEDDDDLSYLLDVE